MAKGMKRSRTSPKKSEKGSMADASQARRDLEWISSTLTESNLNEMVMESIIPDREIGKWRSAMGEVFPTPDTHEIVVFEAHFVRGFGLPDHPFLHNLL